MHDYPYFFNPDERNMASAITRFRLPGNFNPHFFAYGQFPMYLAFFSDIFTRGPLAVLQGVPLNNSTDFPTAIYWLRFWSALSSVFTVYLIYLISREILPQKAALFAALITSFLPGLVQSAHFGTTESLLTLFFMAVIYLSIKLLNSNIEYRNSKQITNSNDRNHKLFRISDFGFRIFALSAAIGLSLGSKLTGVFFFIPPLTSLMVRTIKLFSLKKRKAIISGLFENLRIGLLVFIGSIFFFILSSPYNLKEMQNFQSAVFGYETDVATGKYDAFYTRQFVDSIPILFQLDMIFPYTLGLPIFILGSFGFLIAIFTLNKNFKYKILIIAVSFLAYLIPNAFLFAKWTRFMTPILPFFSIFSVYGVQQFYIIVTNLLVKSQNSNLKTQIQIVNLKSKKSFKILVVVLTFAICVLTLLPGITFMSIYINEDTRVTASKWIYENIPDKSYILSETANVVDIPLGLPTSDQRPKTNDYTVISFDFYHLDENPILFEDLLTHLEKADYTLIPSRRIFANYPKLPQKYPLVTKYYQLLFSGNLGFEKVKEISVRNDEQAEETFTVFDHPVIRIYQKVKPFTKKEYISLFKV